MCATAAKQWHQHVMSLLISSLALCLTSSVTHSHPLLPPPPLYTLSLLRPQCQKSGLQGRGADEIKQVCQGLVTTLDEMAKACPPLQQAEKDAAMAAAAAANAAAAAAGRPPAATSTTNKNASVAYVNGLRDALIKAGLESKLPPACARVSACVVVSV